MKEFDDKCLLGLRNKIIEALGHGESSDKALDAIVEFFKLPTHLETCRNCEGRGRIPWQVGSVPCPQCYMAGQMKVTEWRLP